MKVSTISRGQDYSRQRKGDIFKTQRNFNQTEQYVNEFMALIQMSLWPLSPSNLDILSWELMALIPFLLFLPFLPLGDMGA